MFAKVLIANRGEIACRVAATCARLGIATVAVYSSADQHARHVRQCDEAICIGPAPAAQSYLAGERIVDAARATGAEAIHPGYGFLAENPAFVRACETAGLRFIGPPAEVVRAMGEKHEAKRIMEQAGVATIPGYSGDQQDPDQLQAAADGVGYPLLIKAVAGGGGKGMRLVTEASGFESALAAVRREATAAFADGRVLLERFVPHARHIEVQVFADSKAHVVHLFERDCSVQRRRQKVIEEAPAPGLGFDLRARLHEAAVTATRAIGYCGAGTVEFLLDQSQAFYFMEMNTRLQVEHGVTELITGVDLVEWQLRVASGESLPADQQAITCTGHAVEVRLYAEDPGSGFLPSTGRLHFLDMPADDRSLRIDTGVAAEDSISPHYDPLIAKLMVTDRSRTAAIARLSELLPRVRIAGVMTNLGFLAAITGNPAFQTGDYDTGLVERHCSGTIGDPPPPAPLLALAVLALVLERNATATLLAGQRGSSDSPWFSTWAWRLNAPPADLLTLHYRGQAFDLQFAERAAGWVVTFDGQRLSIHDGVLDGHTLTATVDGLPYRLDITRDGSELWVQHQCDVYRFRSGVESTVSSTGSTAGDFLVAPMPGNIVAIRVNPGDQVRGGDTLLILEAMKMEHSMCAPREGLVAEVLFATGDQVNEGDILITLTNDSATR